MSKKEKNAAAPKKKSKVLRWIIGILIAIIAIVLIIGIILYIKIYSLVDDIQKIDDSSIEIYPDEDDPDISGWEEDPSIEIYSDEDNPDVSGWEEDASEEYDVSKADTSEESEGSEDASEEASEMASEESAEGSKEESSEETKEESKDEPSKEPKEETSKEPKQPKEESKEEPKPPVEPYTPEKIDDKDLINIILIGTDTFGETRGRSDVMILCTYNKKTNEMSMISFLRDLYVKQHEGYKDNRLNAAYRFGGFPYLYEAFETNFGVKIDGGFEVNYDTFRKVIEVLGGVDVELTEQEVEYFRKNRPDFKDLHVGVNHLNSHEALAYVRIRKIDSDFHRTRRQQKLLTSVFESVKNAGAGTIYSLINDMMPYIKTNMSNGQIMSLLWDVVPHLSSMKLTKGQIPVKGAYYDDVIRGMMVLVPDLKKNQKAIKDFMPLD